MNRRLLKLCLASYALKTLLLGLAWWAVPDLPDRAREAATRTWRAISGPALSR